MSENIKQQEDKSMELHILHVAERLFLEKGYAMTTTTEIAREAGCNQALVHYYYRTKERLFEQVFAQKVHLFSSSFVEIERKATSFQDKLRGIVGAHFDVMVQNPKIPFLLVNEITTNPARMEALKHEMKNIPFIIIESLQKDIDREVAAGRVRSIRALDLAVTILTLDAGTFLALPIVSFAFDNDKQMIDDWLALRKEEIITTLINRLKP